MYRDQLDATLHRIQRIRDELAEREALLTPLLLEHVPAELRERLEQSKGESAREADDLESAQAVDRALEVHSALLDELFGIAPDIEGSINVIPDEVCPDDAAAARGLPGMPVLPTLGLVSPPDDWDRAQRLFPRLVAEIDPKAEMLDPPKAYVIDCLVRFEGMPVAIRMQPDRIDGNYSGEIAIAVATRVRSVTPKLEVRPLAFIHAITTTLRIHKDRRFGDDAFDDRFLVLGDEGFAKRVLVRSARAALLRIADFDVPSAKISDGAARITWRYDITLPPLRAAMRVLHHVRGLDTTVSLLQG